MNTIEEKREVTINALLYILSKLGDPCDYHKLFKILYFAEQKHLVRFGSAISEDSYCAMKNGPVPSLAYDIVKSLRNGAPTYSKLFEQTGPYSVGAISEPDLEYLSKSEIDCINESVNENKNLSFTELTRKSHDAAWNGTKENREIDIIQIAQAGGADDDMLAYIEDNRMIKFAEFE